MSSDLNILILTALKDKVLYGLEIIDTIKKDTNDEVVLKQPSLYSALRRLEERDFVSSFWKDSSIGGKRHYYKITPQGINYLNKSIKIQEATKEYLNENNSTNFSYQPTYTAPQNNFNTIQSDDDILFPDIDENLEIGNLYDEDEDEENEESNSPGYKNVLESYLGTPSKKQNIESTKKESKIDYAKEFEKLFGKSETETPTSFEQPKTQPQKNVNSIELLEEITKRHNTYTINTKEPAAEEIQAALENDIKEKKKLEMSPINRDEQKYLLINKIRSVSMFCVFIINILEMAALFFIYLFNKWIGLEQYIILGSGIFIALICFLTIFIQYLSYKDKKIHKNFKWGLSLLYRFIVFVLLVVFIISFNLIIGMNNLTNYIYLLRWLAPCLIVFNIILMWIFNLILSKQKKFRK